MKNIKLVISIMLIISLFWSLSGCSMFGYVKAITPDKFKEAAQEAYDIDYNDINEYEVDLCHFNFTNYYIEPVQGCLIILSVGNPSDPDCQIAVTVRELNDNPHTFENEYDIDEIRSNYNEDNCFIILTTSDEDFIEKYSSDIDYQENCDSILYAEYYNNYRMITIICMYDSRNPGSALEDTYEFIDYLGLPSL